MSDNQEHKQDECQELGQSVAIAVKLTSGTVGEQRISKVTQGAAKIY